MVRLTRQQGVPVTRVDDKFVVGFDPQQIKRLIADAGRPLGPGHVSLGAAVADASKILMKQGVVPVFGAYVGRVRPGSPAEKLRLQPGDIITELNFRPITNADGVEEAMKNLQRGQRLGVTFLRGNQTLRSDTTA